jgi:hypothetical protein
MAAINAKFETITPERAVRILQRNPMNRKLSRHRVQVIARDIKEGRFVQTGEPIIIDKKDELVSGQHRLSALIESGVEQLELLVVRGVDPDSRLAVDQGRPRSAADTLEMVKASDTPSTLAATARFVAAWDRGDLHKRSQVTGLSNAEVLDFIHKHPEVHSSVEIATNLKMPRGMFPRGALGGLHYIFARKQRTEADAFWLAVAEGEGLNAGDPRLALRERLLESAISKTKRLPFRSKVALAVKAWNLWRAGKSTGRFTLSKREAMPELE